MSPNSTRLKAYKGDKLGGSIKSSVKKQKRRNVLVTSSESESDADNSKPTAPDQKFKLRKLINDDKLDAETRKAQKDKELRKIKEKEKYSKGRKSVSESSHKMSKAYKGDKLDGSAKLSVSKRKRVNVQVIFSESESDGDSSKPTAPGQKRCKLPKLIDDDKLSAETRRAQKDEELRKIKGKEKHGKEEESDQLVLDSSGDIIDVEPTIAFHLKPHQRGGVKFLWDCCCENLKRLRTSQGSGAILAHCMGLGKSLQVK